MRRNLLQICRVHTLLRACLRVETLEAKNPRTAPDTRGRLNLHFLGMFGDDPVTGLNKAKLEGWLNSLVFKGPHREAVRRSKDTANRVLSMVKALLNHALRHLCHRQGATPMSPRLDYGDSQAKDPARSG